MIGTVWMRKQVSHANCRWSKLLLVLITKKVAIAPVKPEVEYGKPDLKEKIFDNEHFKLWRGNRVIIFHGGRTKYAKGFNLY